MKHINTVFPAALSPPPPPWLMLARAVQFRLGRAARGFAPEGHLQEDGARQHVPHLPQARQRGGDGEVADRQGVVAVVVGAPDEDEENGTARERHR